MFAGARHAFVGVICWRLPLPGWRLASMLVVCCAFRAKPSSMRPRFNASRDATSDEYDVKLPYYEKPRATRERAAKRSRERCGLSREASRGMKHQYVHGFTKSASARY